jgi:hypothetical protein
MKRLPEQPEENDQEDDNVISIEAKVIDGDTGEEVMSLKDGEISEISTPGGLLGKLQELRETAEKEYSAAREASSVKENMIEGALTMFGWDETKEDGRSIYSYPDPNNKRQKYVLIQEFPGIWSLTLKGQKQIVDVRLLGEFVARLHDHDGNK